MNTLLNGNIHEVKEWTEALEKKSLEEPSAIEVPWEELIQDEREGKKRKSLIKWLKVKAKASRDTSITPEFSEPCVSEEGPRMVEMDLRPCLFRTRYNDVNGNPVCEIHGDGICFPCSHGGLNVCRIACEVEEHKNIEQTPVVYAQAAGPLGDPSIIESMSLGEFDSEGKDD